MPHSVLPNGVRVLSQEIPDFGSVTVGIWVENGSRYERSEQAGISHFLEHLFFKIRIKLFGHYKPVNSFQERKGCLFRERIHSPDPEECKQLFKIPDSILTWVPRLKRNFQLLISHMQHIREQIPIEIRKERL